MADSTRPIRALTRGLDALVILNRHDGATVSEVSAEIRLPRTTTYRVLETLREAGYVSRDPSDDRYRPAIKVRGLSAGFADEAWITDMARPILRELGRTLIWPLSLGTLSGTTIMVRETTDHSSPLAVERFAPGYRLPLLTSAAGRAYLAWCPSPQRETLVDILSRSAREEDRLARNAVELSRILNETRAQRYASAVRARGISDEIELAVPVRLGDAALACLMLRFSASAVPMKEALERFLPRLEATAAKLGSRFGDQRSSEPQGER